MFLLNKRGGLTVEREALHASPGYKRQIEALAKLRKRGAEMSAMTLEKANIVVCSHIEQGDTMSLANLRMVQESIDAHLTAHAQMVDKVREVIDRLRTKGQWIELAQEADKLDAAIGDAK